eukprot:g1161.t1
MYEGEIARELAADAAAGGGTEAGLPKSCWTAVCHASKTPELNALNVAMPDLSCEYWCTFVPAGYIPLFELAFPNWAVYCALTLYSTQGLPIASIHSGEAAAALEQRVIVGAGGEEDADGGEGKADQSSNNDPRILADKGGGRVLVDVFGGSLAKRGSGPVCAILRLYRPDNVEIIPHDEKPSAYLVKMPPVGDNNWLPADWQDTAHPLQVAPQAAALENGNRIGADFVRLISKCLKPLKEKQLGTQFFAPANVAGLFPNANATYVIAFLPPRCGPAGGMIIKGHVPPLARWRPYYGVMAVSHATTETTDTLTMEALGGWGSDFKLFVFRDAASARKAGYDGAAPDHHKLLLWNDAERPGVVLRYLHFFEATAGLSPTDVDLARAERGALCGLDGTMRVAEDQAGKLPGLGIVEYVASS